MYGAQFEEVHALLGSLSPATHNSEQNIGWLAMANYERVAVVINGGSIGTSLDIDIEIATSAGGADIHTLKSTALIEDDNPKVVINLRAEEFSQPEGAPATEYTHFRVECNVSGNCVFGVEVFGFLPRGASVDTSAWDEVVN